jgi:hypothetical protein
MELDIDVHDFSIGQLEKDVTRGPETSKDNNPIEDKNVCMFHHQKSNPNLTEILA